MLVKKKLTPFFKKSKGVGRRFFLKKKTWARRKLFGDRRRPFQTVDTKKIQASGWRARRAPQRGTKG